MNVPRLAMRAARVLRTRSLEPKRVPEPFTRERGIATIERALIDRRRRRLRTRISAVLAAAMVLGGVWLFAVATPSVHDGGALSDIVISVEALPLGEGATVVRAHGDESLEGGIHLESGDRVATRVRGGALLNLSTGTRLQLDGDTHFVVQGEGSLQRFSLDRGVLDANVAHLHRGQRFVVDTPDAQVEVRGTAFRLSSLSEADACNEGVRTRLAVREGAVEVRSAGRVFRVEAGQSWPAQCRPTEDAAEELEVPESEPTKKREEPKVSRRQTSVEPSFRAVSSRVAPSRAGASITSPGIAAVSAEDVSENETTGQSASQASKPSGLSEQTELFARGLAAQRRGDVSSALRSYAELSVKYPRSPLAENAMVERMRLLSRRNPQAARREAERYLGRYAHGFARHEAELLLGQP